MTIRKIEGFTPKAEYVRTYIAEDEVFEQLGRPGFVHVHSYASLRPEENEIGSIVDVIKTEFDGGYYTRVVNIKERIFINGKETQT